MFILYPLFKCVLKLFFNLCIGFNTYIFLIFILYWQICWCVSPWYNCNGWLGIKHQITYILNRKGAHQFQTKVTESHVCLIHCYNVKTNKKLNKTKNIHLSMWNNICFGTDLDFIRIHHGNLLKSLVTMSRVTYFIPWTHVRNGVSQN